MSKVAIVGGGMAGLAAAFYLNREAIEKNHPLKIALFESEQRLGGKVLTVKSGPYRLEAGPDAFVRYKPWFYQLIKDLGLAEKVVGTTPAKPAAFIFKGGKGYPLPEGLNVVIPSRFGPLLTTRLLSVTGKLRAAMDIFLPRGTAADEPFGAFIERRLGKEVWRNLAAPLTGGIYGGDPYELSTMAAFPMLKDLEQKHRSLILGSLQTMRKRRGSREGGSLFASLQEGLGSVIEAILRTTSLVEWRTGAAVERVENNNGRWYLFGPWGAERFDALILALPAWAAAELLRPLDPDLATPLSQIPYGDTATVTMLFARESFPHIKGHGILIAAGEGSSARGFTWLSQKWSGRAPVDKLLARAYFSGPEAGLDDSSLLAAAYADLQHVVGPTPEPEQSWVYRWRAGMPQYTLGHLDRIGQLQESLVRWPGLQLIGSAYRGVGLPEVVRDGKAAAERIADYLRNPL